jgi:hypothetical protein
MNEAIELFILIIAFICAGIALNHIGELFYWAWVDWKYRKKK